MTVTSTIGKQEKLASFIKQIRSSNVINNREIANIVGLFEAVLPSVGYVMLHLSYWWRSYYDGYCNLDKMSMKQLICRLNNFNLLSKICLPCPTDKFSKMHVHMTDVMHFKTTGLGAFGQKRITFLY